MYKCENCGTEYVNWLGKQLCRVCFQRSNSIEFTVKIPWTAQTQEQLEALHKRAGNTFTVADANEAIQDIVSQRFGIRFENVQVRCERNPRWR